jgi:sugar phosphate isomerase/epimerase
MPRIAIHQTTTYRWSFDEDLSGLRDCGAAGVGIWRKKFSDFGEERALLLLQESELAVSSFGWAGGFTGADGASFDEAILEALEALHWAHQCRAGCLCVVSGARGGHTRRHARRLLCEALTTLAGEAASRGLHVALQPSALPEDDRSSFVASLDEALEVVARCGHARVGLCLDLRRLARLNDWGTRLPGLIGAVRLVTVDYCTGASAPHAAAADNPDWPLLIKRLHSSGYVGWHEVRARCQTCWQRDYLQLLPGILRDLGLPADQRQTAARAEPEARAPAAALEAPDSVPSAAAR